jgi:hypothetical protein
LDFMDLKRKYLLAGVLWGLVVGYGAVAIATGVGVAFLFMLVYGEGHWGESTDLVLYGLGLAGLVASMAICTGVGYLQGRKASAVTDAAERNAEHRRANILLGTALLAVLMGAYQLRAQNLAMVNRQAHLEQLLESRHVVSDVHASHRSDDKGFDVAVSASGARAGAYSLEVLVRDRHGRMLHSQRHQIDAPGHEIYRQIPVEYADLLRRIVERDHAGQERGEHRDLLTLVVRLVPTLDRRELRTLPRHAAANHLAPDSPFYSERGADFPLEFKFESGVYWVVVRDELHRVRP